MRLISMFRRSRKLSAQLIVAVDAAERAGAQWVTGDLSLPVAVIWGEFSLPAGEYTFIVPSFSPQGVVYVQREGRDALVVATAVERRPRARVDELTLVRGEAHYFVRSLELRDPAIVFHFEVPMTASASPDRRWRSDTASEDLRAVPYDLVPPTDDNKETRMFPTVSTRLESRWTSPTGAPVRPSGGAPSLVLSKTLKGVSS